MIHELTLQAVKRKLYDFDHVPRFINACEITCALGIGFQEAGLAPPMLETGADVMDVLSQYTPEILSSSKVNEHVKEALRKYFKLNEFITEDAVITMKLGYETKLPAR